MTTIVLNKRFVLEQTGRIDGYEFDVIDLYKGETIGTFWKSGEIWNFQIGDDWRNGCFGTERDKMITMMRRRLPVTLRRAA